MPLPIAPAQLQPWASAARPGYRNRSPLTKRAGIALLRPAAAVGDADGEREGELLDVAGAEVGGAGLEVELEGALGAGEQLQRNAGVAADDADAIAGAAHAGG